MQDSQLNHRKMLCMRFLRLVVIAHVHVYPRPMHKTLAISINVIRLKFSLHADCRRFIIFLNISNPSQNERWEGYKTRGNWMIFVFLIFGAIIIRFHHHCRKKPRKYFLKNHFLHKLILWIGNEILG